MSLKKSALFVLTLALPISIAYASDCYVIQNMDARMLCQAKAEKDAGRCQYIQNADKRNYCLAIMKHEKGQCQYIQDRD